MQGMTSHMNIHYLP
ncbi:MAG: hypothetical protein ACRCXC_12475 [Legionella sp.]